MLGICQKMLSRSARMAPAGNADTHNRVPDGTQSPSSVDVTAKKGTQIGEGGD
jgi:hypothetical protein